MALDGGLLTTKSSVQQLRAVYDGLELRHGLVSASLLLSGLSNASDVLCIDSCVYEGGQRVVCRVRLGSETQLHLGRAPAVAVVPSRMLWQEEGGWMLEGQKVKSFAQIGSGEHEMALKKEINNTK